MSLPRLGQIHFFLASPLQTHRNFFFLNARAGQKRCISQNSPTLGASCYAQKRSNTTVASDGEILFNGLLLTANSSHLTATAGHLTQQILIIKHSEYWLKSSNQETAYKIIKSCKTATNVNCCIKYSSKYTKMKKTFNAYSFAACQTFIIRKLEAFLSTNQTRSGVKGR